MFSWRFGAKDNLRTEIQPYNFSEEIAEIGGKRYGHWSDHEIDLYLSIPRALNIKKLRAFIIIVLGLILVINKNHLGFWQIKLNKVSEI